MAVTTLDAAREPAVHPMVGVEIGKYRVVRLIGKGGMGSVFEAVHTSIGQRVAIKVLNVASFDDPAVSQRFFNEARATSMVQHVGLVKVFDFGTLSSGRAYILMEYLEGESLRARLQNVGGSLPLTDALQITRQIAAALAAAHSKHIVHRDLKPENILLVPDPETPSGERPKVLDFGVAKILETSDAEDEQALRTTTGAILGTPAYMAPEQCRGIGGVTDKADVYSLGVMLYQMIAGQLPFLGKGSGELIAMHLYEIPKLLRTVAPETPEDVEAMVSAMLAKAPEERPGMNDVVSVLEDMGVFRTSGHAVPASASSRGGEHVTPVPARPSWLKTAPPRTPAPARSQRRFQLAILGIFILIISGVTGVLLWQRNKPRVAAEIRSVSAPGGPPAPAETLSRQRAKEAPPALPTPPAVLPPPPPAAAAAKAKAKVRPKAPLPGKRPSPKEDPFVVPVAR